MVGRGKVLCRTVKTGFRHPAPARFETQAPKRKNGGAKGGEAPPFPVHGIQGGGEDADLVWAEARNL